MKRDFSKAGRIVVKVGTSALTYETGKLNFYRIDRLARDLCDLKNRGKEVLLVSSGAIAAGVNRLHLPQKPNTVSGRQAMACVGQSALMELYNKCFADYGYNAGQFLLTKDVFDNAERKKNFQNTVEEMLKYNVIPVINENDSISIEEIKFGDNDNLSSLVARLVHADLLILLSDIDGVYDKDPRSNSDAKLIHTVSDLNHGIECDRTAKPGSLGTGGIYTKITACTDAAKNGIDAVVANSRNLNVIYDILDGKDVGTYFVGDKKNGR